METGWRYVCRHGNGSAVVFGWEGTFPQSDAGLCCFDKLGKAFTTSLGSEDYIYREGWRLSWFAGTNARSELLTEINRPEGL